MPDYIGRFAPSPTGCLHLGSLVSALASYLDARAHGGLWRLRLEDIDPPREQAGARTAILASLANHGLQSPAPVSRQSQHSAFYDQALAALQARGLLYACRCSARLYRAHREQRQHCACRDAGWQWRSGASAWRLRVDPGPKARVEFDDRCCGRVSQDISAEVGDFVLRRRDGYYAYQLAVVVDDAREQISHVVRGRDLLEVTARQIYLQRLLGLPTPSYLHTQLVLNERGAKLSKQNQAPALDETTPLDNLKSACQHLKLPAELAAAASIPQLLQAATASWSSQNSSCQPTPT